MPQTTRSKAIPVLDLSPEIEALYGELMAAIARVVKSGQFIMGPDVRAFEEEVADYLQVKHAIGVNSGTDALVIGLRALDIGPGDEVITTPFSFFATAESISNVGATPVFVDIDERTFNLDPEQIEEAITPNTRAIMPVHLYGNPCDMDRIMHIASKHDLKVIEDAAQSFGARYQGVHTGTIGDVGAYSFFPSKNLGAFGDAGLIATNNDHLAETARMLRTHGAKKKYHNEMLGYNSRLDTIQAAVLRVKLPHVDTWNQQRREAATRYNEHLDGAPGIITPHITEGHVFHQYTVRITAGSRDELQVRLKEAGIGTMVYYPVPQDRLPVYDSVHAVCGNSAELASQVLSLPLWPSICLPTQHYVAESLTRLLG